MCQKALESSPEKKNHLKKGGGLIAVQTWWCFQGAPRWSIRSAGCAHMGLGILEIGFDPRVHSWWFPHTQLKRVGKQVSLMKIRSMRTYSETLCRHSDSSHWRKLWTQHLCRWWCTPYYWTTADRTNVIRWATATNGLVFLPLRALF